MENNSRDALNYQIVEEKLLEVLSKKFDTKIVDSTFSEERLQGGSVAEVRLISGTARTCNGTNFEYKIVLKIQEKWTRFSDENSWRREYDLYNSNLEELFTDDFSWPQCYHSEIEKDETTIWMEYISGTPGSLFNVDSFEKAAKALGRFQGKIYSMNKLESLNTENLSELNFIKNTFTRYSTWQDGLDFLNSTENVLPKHLKSMLLELISNCERYWFKIQKLPIVLSQRDYWFTNIFILDNGVKCIDWDTTGYGYLGEDIASLIVDEVKPDLMVELYKKCVPAYYRGFKEFVPEFNTGYDAIYELILVSFALKIMANLMYSKSSENTQLQLATLESIYQMKDIDYNL